MPEIASASRSGPKRRCRRTFPLAASGDRRGGIARSEREPSQRVRQQWHKPSTKQFCGAEQICSTGRRELVSEPRPAGLAYSEASPLRDAGPIDSAGGDRPPSPSSRFDPDLPQVPFLSAMKALERSSVCDSLDDRRLFPQPRAKRREWCRVANQSEAQKAIRPKNRCRMLL